MLKPILSVCNMKTHSSVPFDISSWLSEIGFSQYAAAIVAEDISFEVLLNLTHDDLKECGVFTLGHRKAILSAIAELQAQSHNVAFHFDSVPENCAPLQEVTYVSPLSPELSDSLSLESPETRVGADIPHEQFPPAMVVPETASPVVREEQPKRTVPHPSAVFGAHTPAPAPPEKLSLAAKIRRAYSRSNGSSLLLSIGIHAVIILVGGYLVVSQVVEERKISFGGGDRRPQAEVQHKVKAKPRAATAPNTSKRITTTSSVAKVSLPDMPNVQLNVGPTIAASMGSGGFGAVGNLGGGSMPQGKGSALSKITFFGLRGGAENNGLIGTFYDLKQTPQRKPTKMASSPDEKGVQYGNKQNAEYVEVLRRFCVNWNPVFLDGFFKAPQKLCTTQIFIPNMSADEAPKAFGVEKECEGRRWLVHYKGEVVPPKSGRFRFRGRGDDVLMVRWDEQTVLDANWPGLRPAIHPKINTAPEPEWNQFVGGKWIEMKKGIPVKVEVLIGEHPGGLFRVFLCLEEEKVSYPNGYPLFQLKGGPVLTNTGFPVSNEGIVFGLAPTKTAVGAIAGNAIAN